MSTDLIGQTRTDQATTEQEPEEWCGSCLGLLDEGSIELDPHCWHVCSSCWAAMSPYERLHLRLCTSDSDREGGFNPGMQLWQLIELLKHLVEIEESRGAPTRQSRRAGR